MLLYDSICNVIFPPLLESFTPEVTVRYVTATLSLLYFNNF